MDAVSTVKRTRPDLMLLDIKMSPMKGIEVLERVM
jgi:CheY-like chemotaxis protein